MNRRLLPMNHHEPAKENTNRLLQLFVYGTLKRGFWNHDRFCQGVLSVEEAEVTGRLYQFPSGIPILQVPKAHILAHGTSSPLADLATQRRFTEKLAQHLDLQPQDAPVGDWGLVSGELLTFSDPESRLPAIDRLEGYRPGGPFLYRRVLAPVTVSDQVSTAWIYIGNPEGGEWERLFSGAWPEKPR